MGVHAGLRYAVVWQNREALPGYLSLQLILGCLKGANCLFCITPTGVKRSDVDVQSQQIVQLQTASYVVHTTQSIPLCTMTTSPIGLVASGLCALCLLAVVRMDMRCDVQPLTTAEHMTALAVKEYIRSDSLLVAIDMDNVWQVSALWQRPCIPRAQQSRMVNTSSETLEVALHDWTPGRNHCVFLVGSADPSASLRAIRRVTRNSDGPTNIVVVNGCCGLKPSVVNYLLRMTRNYFDCTCDL